MSDRKRTFGAMINTFDAAWINLERQHKVDGRGGMQYSRVLREWLVEGAPDTITAFILANRQDAAPKAEPPHAVPLAVAEPPQPLPASEPQQPRKLRPRPAGEGGDRP